MFVIDCSVVSTWLLPDETSQYDTIFELMTTQTTTLFVPSLFYLEISNVLLVAKRRNRVSEDIYKHALILIEKMPLTVDTESKILPSIITLAEQYTLSIYDATYLELAKRHNIPLLTCDKALKKAAQSEGLFKF